MELWQPKNVAAFLGMNAEYLIKQIKKGALDIPHRRRGMGPKSRYIFVKEQVEEWASRPIKYIDPRRMRAV